MAHAKDLNVFRIDLRQDQIECILECLRTPRESFEHMGAGKGLVRDAVERMGARLAAGRIEDAVNALTGQSGIGA